MRLVSAFNQALMELDLSITAFKLLLQLLDLLEHAFSFLLLLLKSVRQEQALLDAALGCCWSLSDGLDESVSNIISPFALDLVVLSDMHNSLI